MIAVAVWLVETVFMMIGAVVTGTVLSDSLLGVLLGLLLAVVLLASACRRLRSC